VRFEDTLSIAVIVEKIGKKSVSYRYEFRCGEREIAIGRMTAVYCREVGHGKLESAEIPIELRKKLEG
jgi:acyl-CoA thioesterase FadM